MSKQLSKTAQAHFELEELKRLRDQLDPLPPGDLRNVLERKFNARWDALNLLLCPELPAEMMEEIKALPCFSHTSKHSSNEPSEEEVLSYCAQAVPPIPNDFARWRISAYSGRELGWPRNWRKSLLSDWLNPVLRAQFASYPESPTSPRISHDIGRAASRAAWSDPASMQNTPRTRIKWKLLEEDPNSGNLNYVIRELLQHAYELEEELTLLRVRYDSVVGR